MISNKCPSLAINLARAYFSGMTHPLVLKHSPPNYILEQEVDKIIGDYDLEQLVERTTEATEATGSRLVKGTVLDIKNDFVVVDLGGKFDGRLRYSEEGSNCDDLDVGDEAHFVVSKVEKSGVRILSRKNIDKILQHRNTLGTLKVGLEIEGTLHRRTNLGWLVDIRGLFALLPHKDEFIFYGDEDPDSFAGNTVVATVKLIDEDTVVLTRESYAEETKRLNKTKSLAPLAIGQIITGVIKNVAAFGAFIQIPGSVIGLCHVSDFGDYTPRAGKTVVSRILRIDKGKNRVSLGIRQASEPSWSEIIKKYRAGNRITGSVRATLPYGAFIELEPGVSGLLHISDLSWSDHIKHTRELLAEGESVEVVILGFDMEKQHISLGYKQLTDDPWSTIDSRYLTGSKITGELTTRTKFGLFIKLEDGVEGLAHHSLNSKNLKIGSEVLVEVIRVDSSRKKVSLSVC